MKIEPNDIGEYAVTGDVYIARIAIRIDTLDVEGSVEGCNPAWIVLTAVVFGVFTDEREARIWLDGTCHVLSHSLNNGRPLQETL